MVSEGTQNASAPTPDQRGSFFRQSGWLMIANIAGGALMWGLHFLAKRLKEGEYGTFGALLSVVAVLPTIPLQMVFAQQTAKALATGRQGELAGMIRLVFLGTLALWLVGAGVVLFQQDNILKLLQVKDPVGLWLMIFSCLFAAWMPMFCGVLQGQQNFLWLGWAMMLNGVGRLGLAAVAVFAVGGYAAGMVSGLLFGLIVGTVIAIWQTAGLWRTPTASFDWRSLLAQVLPLMLGFGAFQFLFLADTMFVKSYFTPTETDAYVGAGTLSRALMWLVGPLAAVMFPRIVHSTAKAEKSDLMRTVLLGTFILSVCGALGLWLVGPYVVKIIYPPTYSDQTISLLPWYGFAMVPLALANVLLNNLLARGTFRVVPVLVVLVLGYVFALSRWHDSLVTVVKVLGGFNLLLLAASAWFTHRTAAGAPTSPPR
jgi:O-antigen/teichoic acid export membrane protein